MQNAKKFLVAATLEKGNTYVFTGSLVRDREVGGSNPLAPTNQIKHLRRSVTVAVRLSVGKTVGTFLVPPSFPLLL